MSELYVHGVGVVLLGPASTHLYESSSALERRGARRWTVVALLRETHRLGELLLQCTCCLSVSLVLSVIEARCAQSRRRVASNVCALNVLRGVCYAGARRMYSTTPLKRSRAHKEDELEVLNTQWALTNEWHLATTTMMATMPDRQALARRVDLEQALRAAPSTEPYRHTCVCREKNQPWGFLLCCGLRLVNQEARRSTGREGERSIAWASSWRALRVPAATWLARLLASAVIAGAGSQDLLPALAGG